MDFTKLHVEVDYSQCRPYLMGNPEVKVKQCQPLQNCWWWVGGKQMIYYFAQRDHWIAWPLATMMVKQFNLHVSNIGTYVVGLDRLPTTNGLDYAQNTWYFKTNTHTHTHKSKCQKLPDPWFQWVSEIWPTIYFPSSWVHLPFHHSHLVSAKPKMKSP